MAGFLFFGVLASLLFYELTGLSPGGVIVPAYCVLYLHAPERLLATALVALLAWGLVRLLSQYAVLYGRRLYAVYLLTGMGLKLLLLWLGGQALWLDGDLLLSIGYVVPGLIARDCDRQGVWLTGLSLATVTVALWLLRLAVARW